MDIIDNMLEKTHFEKSAEGEIFLKTIDFVLSGDKSQAIIQNRFKFLLSVLDRGTDNQIRESAKTTCQLISELEGGNRYLCLLRDSIEQSFKEQYPGVEN